MTQVMTSCMLQRIDYTLAVVRTLPSPVVRSCHIGNNTSNNWGWQALARNTRHVQYDHTLYGVDENSSPWLMLGDLGRVTASYDFRGRARPEDIGRHINQVMGSVPRRHRSILNYSIRADHEGNDLITTHITLAKSLASQINGSRISFDSSELLAQSALLEAVIGGLADRLRLDLVFNRWVETTRAGHAVVTPLREIIGDDRSRVRLLTADQRVVFDGSVGDLIACFRIGIEAVHRRLHEGREPGHLGYPWVTLPFSYLWAAITEYAREPTRDEFWHAGGSASQYYINEPARGRALSMLWEEVAAIGYLPASARLHLIPSYGCQLFATSAQGLEMLDHLIELWHAVLAKVDDLEQVGARLGATTAPLDVIQPFVATLTPSLCAQLVAWLDEFNAVEVVKLPVAHVVDSGDDTYNKYGAPQAALLGRTLEFPEMIGVLRWFELELLVKTLAEMSRGRFG